MIVSPSTTSFPVDRTDKPYRIIYAVLFRLAPLPEDAPGSITELVMQLDRRGNAIVAKIQPRDRSKRIVDLRIGDDLLVGRKWRTITAVSSFSDNWLTEEWAASKLKQPNGDGYLHRPASACGRS